MSVPLVLVRRRWIVVGKSAGSAGAPGVVRCPLVSDWNSTNRLAAPFWPRTNADLVVLVVRLVHDQACPLPVRGVRQRQLRGRGPVARGQVLAGEAHGAGAGLVDVTGGDRQVQRTTRLGDRPRRVVAQCPLGQQRRRGEVVAQRSADTAQRVARRLRLRLRVLRVAVDRELREVGGPRPRPRGTSRTCRRPGWRRCWPGSRRCRSGSTSCRCWTSTPTPRRRGG